MKTETITRTLVLAVALANQLLLAFGKNPIPFSEEEIYIALSGVFTVCTSLWAWWKNNSFTKEAIRADAYLKELKNETEQER